LRTVAGNACKDALKKCPPTVELQEGDRICEDFAEKLAQDELLRVARERTRARVADKEWQVFRLMEIEGLRDEQVAEQTALGIGTVYNYRSRVRAVYQQQLRDRADPDEE
jgi:DNA-directed RNA polymerase specialized sigma24 family protein